MSLDPEVTIKSVLGVMARFLPVMKFYDRGGLEPFVDSYFPNCQSI